MKVFCLFGMVASTEEKWNSHRTSVCKCEETDHLEYWAQIW